MGRIRVDTAPGPAGIYPRLPWEVEDEPTRALAEAFCAHFLLFLPKWTISTFLSLFCYLATRTMECRYFDYTCVIERRVLFTEIGTNTC